MLMILSPAKTMQEKATTVFEGATLPEFLGEASLLVAELRKISAERLMTLMKINPQLAQLNYGRFQQWDESLHTGKGVPALFSYQGEVFRGLDAASLGMNDLRFAQEHLRILSGLYGVLRPKDYVLPYRLEMGGNFSPKGFRNLYDFWKPAITGAIGAALAEQGDNVLVNLASNEYFKVLDKKKLNARMITPVFKESRADGFKMVTVYAKKARGLMARFVIRNRLSRVDELKLFDEEGYFFNASLSKNDVFVFTR